MRKRICCVVLGVVLGFPQAAVLADDASGQKAILITGASSGIGRNMAETLAANGWFVYAGARKQADIDALNAIENIQAVRLDLRFRRRSMPPSTRFAMPAGACTASSTTPASQ